MVSSGRRVVCRVGGLRTSSGDDFFASRPVVVVATLVIGAPRAPAFGDGVLAVAKRGQKTGGPGDSLNQLPLLGTGAVSDRIRASDAYAPEQPVQLPSSQSEAGARA